MAYRNKEMTYSSLADYFREECTLLRLSLDMQKELNHDLQKQLRSCKTASLVVQASRFVDRVFLVLMAFSAGSLIVATLLLMVKLLRFSL